jgi:hypothetical protein
MNDTDINDKRSLAEFKGVTFSKFQKNKVKTELINSLNMSKVESACYWTAELVCAGHFGDLWEIILLFVSKYIHLGNPKLPIYLSMRFKNFKELLCSGYIGNELALRNNMKVRNLFAEVISLLCHSRKKHNLEAVKIQKAEEFNISHMASRLKAPTVGYIKDLFKPDDPKELYIALNEFAYHISCETKNSVSACYWLEWILEYETLCKQKKEICVASSRQFTQIQDKYIHDIIWLVWDVILREGEAKKHPLRSKILNALLELFSLKYSSGVKKRRKFLIYFAISILTEPVDYSIEIIQNKTELDAIIKKVGIVYRDVKKNEDSLNVDYLFSGLAERSNLDKTIERLEKMNGAMRSLPAPAPAPAPAETQPKN